MPSVALKELLPLTVDFAGRSYRRLEDRHVYDTVTVATGDRVARFFLTTDAKEISEANFRGDFSLVREDNIFVPLQLSIQPRIRLFTRDEYLGFFGRGYITFQIKDPQKITVLEDRLVNVSPSVSPERFTTQNNIDEAVPWGRKFEDRRTILIPENKIVKGGRNLDWNLNWDEAAGNGLASNTEILSEFYGVEYEPDMPGQGVGR